MRLNPFKKTLPRLPSTALVHEPAAVEVSVAGELTIVAIDPQSAAVLAEACALRRNLQLAGAETTVTFTHKGPSAVVTDPVEGWIIGLDDQLRRRIAAIEPVPGEHDLGRLAIVVELP